MLAAKCLRSRPSPISASSFRQKISISFFKTPACPSKQLILSRSISSTTKKEIDWFGRGKKEEKLEASTSVHSDLIGLFEKEKEVTKDKVQKEPLSSEHLALITDPLKETEEEEKLPGKKSEVDEDEGDKLNDKYFSDANETPILPPKFTPADKATYLKEVRQELNAQEEEKQDLLYKKLGELRLFHYYPVTVKRWVEDMKTPFGYYNLDGDWVTLHETKKISSLSDYPNDQNQDPKAFWNQVPEEFRGHYRFGIKEEDLVDAPIKVKLALTYKDAPQHQIKRFRVRQAMRPYMKNEYDSGESVAQVVAVHMRVTALARHLKFNPHDNASVHRFQRILAQRSKLMKYAKRNDTVGYFKFLKQYGLRDAIKMK